MTTDRFLLLRGVPTVSCARGRGCCGSLPKSQLRGVLTPAAGRPMRESPGPERWTMTAAGVSCWKWPTS
eukprot:10869627-Alexandrium_andersonii.AAC.1